MNRQQPSNPQTCPVHGRKLVEANSPVGRVLHCPVKGCQMPATLIKPKERVLQHRLDGEVEDVTPPRRNRQREEKMQRLLFAWRAEMLPRYPLLRFLFATWNGVLLPPQTVRKLSGLGLKGSKGIIDLWFPVRKEAGGEVICGLVIDLKDWQQGTPTKEQREWETHLRANGWSVHFETSALSAWRVIAGHLGITGEDYEAAELMRQEQWLRREEGE